MKIPKEELLSILSQFNPWWRREGVPDLPHWRRAAYKELFSWVVNPPAKRALMLTGPRQVGKTTLLLQAIDQLLKDGVPPSNILYATFDHPLFKLAGLDTVLAGWRELEPKTEGPEFLFLDEAQFIKDFGTWVKHQVDFSKSRTIVFTGSAMPLAQSSQESGVGRWHTLRLSTLSFYEYLQIKRITLPPISTPSSLAELFGYSSAEFMRLTESTQNLIGHFHEYLCRGGFPQTALIDSIPQAQRLIREDIIDKVLKRDLTAHFGVRRVLELEQLFIYLCMHDGGLQDTTTLSNNLGVTKQTIQNYIHLLESSQLLHRLPSYGIGKEILRARYKLYLADPAIAAAILMKGKTILENPKALGNTVEAAVFTHLWGHNPIDHVKFSFWRGTKDREVDLIEEIGLQTTPFKVKYQSQVTDIRDLQGLVEFCNKKGDIAHGYVLTKSPKDIGLLENKTQTQLIRLPASLFCYWVGAAEMAQKSLSFHS